jgi:hypothetical protein
VSAILGGVVDLFKQLGDPKTAAALGQMFKGLGQIIGDLGGPLGALIGAFARGLAPILVPLAPLVAQLAGDLTKLLNAIPVPVLEVIVAAMIGWAGAWVVLGVAAAIAVDQLITHWSAVRHWFASIGDDIAAPFETAFRNVIQWSKDAADFVTNQFDGVRHNVASIGDDIAKPFVTGFKSVVSWLDSSGLAISNFFTSLPGKIAGWLSSTGSDISKPFISGFNTVISFFEQLPGTLLNIIKNLASNIGVAGENVIIGFYNGLVKGFNELIGGIGNIGHDIANALGSVFGIHFSEPSEATQMIKAGRNITTGLAKGIVQGQTAVSAAMARTDATVTAGAAAAGTGSAQKLQLQFTGNANDQLWQLFKKNIRIKGGNVQIVGA